MGGLSDRLKPHGWDTVSFDATPSADNWTLRKKRDDEGRQVYEW